MDSDSKSDLWYRHCSDPTASNHSSPPAQVAEDLSILLLEDLKSYSELVMATTLKLLISQSLLEIPDGIFNMMQRDTRP